MNIDAVIGLVAGLFGGCFLGVVITCCWVAAGRDDRRMEHRDSDTDDAEGWSQ